LLSPGEVLFRGKVMKNNSSIHIDSKYLQNLGLDLYQLVWELTSQVPKGRVTTYGAIAKALGDIRAARAIGTIEHVNPYAPSVPCHRVVYSDGGIGGYGSPEGTPKKIKLLDREGVKVKDEKIVNFKEVLFDDFTISGPPPLEMLRAEQLALKNEIVLKDKEPNKKLRTIGGIDATYNDDTAFGAIAILDFDTLELVEAQTARIRTRFPYIPTYLSYHELPIIIELMKKIISIPDVIIFDGNGILHPFGLGLATHAGILLRLPTMGIAKKLLVGELTKSLKGHPDVTQVVYNNQLIGYGLKPKTAKKKLVFVSPGNLISFKSALNMAKKVCISRIPEPIRIAHALANEIRKNQSPVLNSR